MLSRLILLVISVAGLLTAAVPLQPRWYPSGSCVTDVKIEICSSFGCELPGYHRIDTLLTQRDNMTSWSYVFYKIEDSISASCVTELRVVEEGQSGPSGADWYPAPHSAHEGVSSGGGPTLWSRREASAQYAGKVVDLVIVKAGKYANNTEDYIRERTNLGLGDAAGTVAYPLYEEYTSVSSGWVYLEYTLAGPRDIITQVQVVACDGNSVGADCGAELISEGWQRRDVDLNGPTANGSHIYLFTNAAPTASGDCVGGLTIVNATGDGVLPVNLNNGTSGDPIYLAVIYSRARVPGSCLTSIVPLDMGYFTPQAGYEPVMTPAGEIADLNQGLPESDPVYLFTSSMTQNPPKASIELAFNSTGQFRIAHFSDLHVTNFAAECRDIPKEFMANCTDRWTARFMSRALDMLQPDLVIINGDLYSDNPRQADGIQYPQLTRGAMAKVYSFIIERGLPFATTYGNHDAEGDLTREEIQRILDAQPGYIGSRGPPALDGIGNYVLNIQKSSGSHDVAHKLWFFDSRSYTYFANNGSSTGAYGQVMQSQLDWYTQTAQNEPSTNAMAFFHIPLGQASGALGFNSTAELGVHGEKVCSQGQKCNDTPDVNNPYVGLLESFVKVGDVKATFSGHDHDNDYSIDVEGIKLTYDGSAGYSAYSAGYAGYNREMRVIDIQDYGNVAYSYKVIDDIFQGTVHRNYSEPIVQLF